MRLHRIRPLAILGAMAFIVAVTALAWVCPRDPGPLTLDVTIDPDIHGYDEPPDAQRSRTFAADAEPLLNGFCVTCHRHGKAMGDIALDVPAADPALWARAADALRSGRMPPPGRPRPRPDQLAAFIAWQEATAGSDPGRVTLRRLNRVEYANTIHDLLGVHSPLSGDFPADDTGEGFDTLGDVLSVSPTLIEKYLAVAEAAIDAVAADPVLWQRLRTPPSLDPVPFALRGLPPARAEPMKGDHPDTDDQATSRAAEIDRAYAALQSFADRAYRRPVTQAETARLMRFVEEALNANEGADAGLKLAFKAVLVSPHFLFRVESDPDGTAADRRLNDFELATRLSYFLWSAPPDDTLFRLACAGGLNDPAAMVGQVRRMLRSSRSRALAENFATQWLQTRALTESAPDPVRFPGFDAPLRRAMRLEAEHFFDHIVRDDQSVLSLLTARYTYVNERLAQHYRLRDVKGDSFRRVSLVGTSRAGVLTQAGVLTVTSGPTRTSPVKRGKWVLDNLLGAPPPPPPPGVDDLKEGDKQATLRQRLEQHRAKPTCAACHARMDPLGFALENFDATGAWRDREADREGDATGDATRTPPIDASGQLPDGTTFRGPDELLALLARHPDDFARCLTEKLLTYALGRALRPADRAAVSRIVRQTARNNYRFSSLIIALTRSDPFTLRGVRSGGNP